MVAAPDGPALPKAERDAPRGEGDGGMSYGTRYLALAARLGTPPWHAGMLTRSGLRIVSAGAGDHALAYDPAKGAVVGVEIQGLHEGPDFTDAATRGVLAAAVEDWRQSRRPPVFRRHWASVRAEVYRGEVQRLLERAESPGGEDGT